MSSYSEYFQKIEDVNLYFQLMNYLCEIESYKKSSVITNQQNPERLHIEQQLQCCVKGQAMILLYNLIESTIRQCILSIFDEINDENIEANKLNEKLKIFWMSKKKNESKQDEHSLSSQIAIFNDNWIKFSGNVDIRKIYEVFQDIGCQLIESEKEKYSDSFLLVKSKRNLLAHGNISLSKCGSERTLKELNKIKNDIVDFLEIVKNRTNSYILNKEFFAS